MVEFAGMANVIIGLVGPARAGKTTLIDAVVEAVPAVRRIKSLTTRAPRDAADHLMYDFLDRAAFEELDRAGQVLERVEHAGNAYGIHKDHLEAVLAQGHGICALVEDGVDYFKRLAVYPIVTIRIVPTGYMPSADPVRQRADAERAARQMATDYTVENRFSAGGLACATADLLAIVRMLN